MSGAYPSLIGYLSTLKVQNFDVVQQARGRSNLGLAAVAATGSASDLTIGTLSDARLSSNVPLKNAENVFSINNTFSQGVRFGSGLQRNIYINHDPSNRGRIEWRETNGFSNGWMGMSATGLDINPDSTFGYRLNVNSALNVTGTGTFGGVVSGAFRASGTGTLTSGNGLEVFMSGSTAFLQSFIS